MRQVSKFKNLGGYHYVTTTVAGGPIILLAPGKNNAEGMWFFYCEVGTDLSNHSCHQGVSSS